MSRPTGRGTASSRRRPSSPRRRSGAASRSPSSPMPTCWPTTRGRSSTRSPATAACEAFACSCIGMRTRSTASLQGRTSAGTRSCSAMSDIWRPMAGASTCRSSRARWPARPSLLRPVPRCLSFCNMPACSRIFRRRASRPGAPAWRSSRHGPTSSRSSRASAPSCAATSRRMSLWSPLKRCACSAPTAASSAPTSRSRSSGPTIPP